MSFIKMTGIDNNKNIVKWLKLKDEEDNNYNYKPEKIRDKVNNKKEETSITESINNLTISESDSLTSVSESDSLTSVSDNSEVSVETNKEYTNLFNTTETLKNGKNLLIILKNEADLRVLYNDIVLKKKKI